MIDSELFVPPTREHVDIDSLAASVTATLEAMGATWRRGELWLRCDQIPGGHAEKTASWAFRPATGRHFCQGCGRKGGVLDLAGLLGIQGERLSAEEHAAWVARRDERIARDAELKAEQAQAMSVWWSAHHERIQIAAELRLIADLLREGVTAAAFRHFGWGQATRRVEDRELGGWRDVEALVIPWTFRGEIRAIQYRLIGWGADRYRWHAGGPGKVWNADAVVEPGETLYVTEGAKKAATLWGHGITSVCALANKRGWHALSDQNRRAFAARRVVFALDPDATAEAREAAASLPNGWVAALPAKPDDMLVDCGGDPTLLQRYLDRARRP